MVLITKLNKLLFGSLCNKFITHGVPVEAEIIPFEPDPDNAGVGIGIREINQAISLNRLKKGMACLVRLRFSKLSAVESASRTIRRMPDYSGSLH